MRVTAKMIMAEHDEWIRRELPEKILSRSRDSRRRAGDAIYNFDQDPPAVHKDTFHTEANRESPDSLGAGAPLAPPSPETGAYFVKRAA
jgi:hypothetical protein